MTKTFKPAQLNALMKSRETYHIGGQQRWIRTSRTIPEIEAIWFRMHQKEQKDWQEKLRPVLEAIYAQGGKAHCVPINSSKNGDKWWEYVVSNVGEHFGQKHCLAYSFNWVDKPAKPVLLELGQKYYNLNLRHDNRELVNQCLVRELLAQRLLSYLNKEFPLPMALDRSHIRDLVINGRHYVFIAEYNQRGFPAWTNKTWATEINTTHLN